MTEYCPCGASIRTVFYRRVREWRAGHQCSPSPEPQREGAHASTVLGFQPNYAAEEHHVRM